MPIECDTLTVVPKVEKVYPTDDTYVSNGDPDKNFGTMWNIEVHSRIVDEKVRLMVGALRFDLSSIDYSKGIALNLYVIANALWKDVELWFCRMVKDWDELEPTAANWLEYGDQHQNGCYYEELPKSTPTGWLEIKIPSDELYLLMHGNILTTDLWIAHNGDYNLGAIAFRSRQSDKKPYVSILK